MSGVTLLGTVSGTTDVSHEASVSLPPETEISMHPSPFSDMLTQLGNHPDEWEIVRRHLTSVQWHHQDVFHDFTTEAGERFADVIPNLHVGTEIVGPAWHDAGQIGEPWDDGVSNRAVERVSEHLRPMEEAGCQIRYVNIDGPYKTSIPGKRPEVEEYGGGFETFDRAAQEIVDFVVEMRAEYPGLSVRIITNFPNWGWKGKPPIRHTELGDYYEAFHVLIDKFEDQNVPKPEGIVVDHPYEYGGRDRIFDLQQEVYDRNLEFHMIVNSEIGGGTSNEAFSQRSFQYLLDLQERGLDPDGYTIESWYPYPDQNVPETDDSTMTGLTRRILELRERAPNA